RLFAAYYDVAERGNFEHGTSILHVTDTPLAVAQRLGVPEARLLEALERGRTILFEARERRIRPARDAKVLSAWNGMLLRALAEATELADAILAQFSDPENGGFFDTSTEHETLITRPKDVFDNATPSGNAVAADVLLRLAVLTANQDYQRAAQGVFELLREPM